MTEETRQILFGLAAPLVIAIVALVIGDRAEPADPTRRARFAWRVPLALAGPVVLAFLGLYGPPREQWQHMVYVAAAGGGVGIVMAVTPRVAWLRALLVVGLGGLVTAAIWPVVRREPAWVRLAPALGTILLVSALQPLARRRPGPTLPGALVLAVGTTAALVLISGWIKLTVPVVTLTMALVPCTVLVPWCRHLSLADGGLAAALPLLVVAPLVAWLYMTSAGNALPIGTLAIPVAAPLLLWLGEIPLIRDRAPRIATPVRWLLVAAACAVAIVLALTGGDATESEDPMEQMYRDMMGGRVVTEHA